MTPTRRIAFAAVVVSIALLAGCGLLYDGHVRKALDQCNRLPDWGDRNACVARINAADDRRYADKRDALADPAAAQTARDKRDRGLCIVKAGVEAACPN